MKNGLKRMLKEGKVAIGTTLTIDHPDVAEFIGNLGYDWILIDTEHAPMEPGSVQHLQQSMSRSKSVPMVRVPWNDIVMIKRVLDTGIYGIVVPWINTKEEAIKAVQAVRYPPLGLRGYGPRRAAFLDPDYVKTANKELLLGAQIETQKAVDNIDEILSVEGIDAALVGPMDLSLSLGVLGNFQHERFVSAMDKIVKSCKKHGVIAGMLAVDDVAKRVKQGFTLLNRMGDFGLLVAAERRNLAEAREAANTGKSKTTPAAPKNARTGY